MKKKIITLLLTLLLIAAIAFVVGATAFLVKYIVNNSRNDSSADMEHVASEKPLLGIDAGAYQMEYVDPETSYYLRYYLYVPEKATADMPLIVFLHGIGEIGSIDSIENNPLIEQIRSVYGPEFPAIILAPNTQSSWSKDSVVNTLKALIDQVVVDYSIDSTRITITGHSMGAGGVFKMISQYNTYFNCAVAISPPSLPDVNVCMEVPVMSIADFGENCNSPLLFFAEKVNSLGGNMIHITLDGYAHNETAYGAFTQEVLEWMLSH